MGSRRTAQNTRKGILNRRKVRKQRKTEPRISGYHGPEIANDDMRTTGKGNRSSNRGSRGARGTGLNRAKRTNKEALNHGFHGYHGWDYKPRKIARQSRNRS
jgi:hypothetical protein